MTLSVGLRANVPSEVQPIIQWSEYEEAISAKISQTTNLVVYHNRGIGSQNAAVSLREMRSGEIRCRWDSQGAAGPTNFSPDGTKILVDISTKRWKSPLARILNSGALRSYVPYVYDTSSCAPLNSIVLKKGNYSGLRFSDDGLYILGVRWSRDFYSQSTLFKVRVDGTEPMQQYHPQPSRVGVYYKLREKDAFLVSRRVDNPVSTSIVSLYTAGKTAKESRIARWWRRESRQENTLVLDRNGPLTASGFTLSHDQSRLAFLWPIVVPLAEPPDIYSVIYDSTNFEESHRWVLHKDRTKSVIQRNVWFFPQSSDLVLSMTSTGTVMIHRLLPELAQLLLQFDTNIEEGTASFSHEGDMFVVSGKVLGSHEEHRILIYRTADLGIEIQTMK